jgi:hypothetical protein
MEFETTSGKIARKNVKANSRSLEISSKNRHHFAVSYKGETYGKDLVEQ